MKKLRYLSILLTLSLLLGLLAPVSFAEGLTEEGLSGQEEILSEDEGTAGEELTELIPEDDPAVSADEADVTDPGTGSSEEEIVGETVTDEVYDTSMGAFLTAEDREGYRADYLPGAYGISEDASIPADGSYPDGFNSNEWKVLKLINTQRGKKGVEPLAGFAALQAVADVRTEEIKKKFSHTRPDGTDCFTAFNVPCWGAGENIAMGFTSASSVMDAWMHSSGHKKNIMYDDFTHVGVGQSGKYWVQCFIGSRDTSCSISVNAPQRILKKGKKISSLGIVVKLEDENGTSFLPLNDYMCSGCNTKKNGIYNVTVTVRGATASFPLVVSSNGKSITIDDIPAIDTETAIPVAIFATGQKLTLPNFAADANEIVKYKITTGTKKASISSTGKFTAKKAGNVIVTAYKKDGFVYYATERFFFRIEKPKFTKKTLKLKPDSETDMNLYLAGLSNLGVDRWESSKPEVAVIDPVTGKLASLSKGTTTISAIFDNGETFVKKTIKVKVK